MSETIEQPVVARSAAQQGSEIPRGWKPTMAEPIPVQRCSVIKKDGERCKRWSLRSADKCHAHLGFGKLKNVSEYYNDRVENFRLDLVSMGTDALQTYRDLLSDEVPPAVREKVASQILDRIGMRGGYEVNVEVTTNTDPALEIRNKLSRLAPKPAAIESDTIDAEIIEDQDTLF